jgi:hypothetical protein
VALSSKAGGRALATRREAIILKQFCSVLKEVLSEQ